MHILPICLVQERSSHIMTPRSCMWLVGVRVTLEDVWYWKMEIYRYEGQTEKSVGTHLHDVPYCYYLTVLLLFEGQIHLSSIDQVNKLTLSLFTHRREVCRLNICSTSWLWFVDKTIIVVIDPLNKLLIDFSKAFDMVEYIFLENWNIAR